MGLGDGLGVGNLTICAPVVPANEKSSKTGKRTTIALCILRNLLLVSMVFASVLLQKLDCIHEENTAPLRNVTETARFGTKMILGFPALNMLDTQLKAKI